MGRPSSRSTRATVTARALELLLAAVPGRDAGAVRAAAGAEGVDLSRPDARVGLEAMAAAWREAVRLTGDPALGLHIAEKLGRGDLGALEYAIRHSETLGQALGQLVRHGRLIHDLAAFELVESGDEALLVLHLAEPVQPVAQGMQLFVASQLRLLSACVAEPLRPREVRFVHDDPGAPGEYERVLGAPVAFSQRQRAVVFDRAQLALPMVEADPTLGLILARYLESLRGALPERPGLVGEVRHAIAEGLAAGGGAEKQVARQLGTSVRTLARRLQEHGHSFRELRADVRLELAHAHLRERKLSIAEIAFLLGFSETSAFQRFFRNATGTTPGALRKG